MAREGRVQYRAEDPCAHWPPAVRGRFPPRCVEMAAGSRSGWWRSGDGPPTFPRSGVVSLVERVLLACARPIDVACTGRPYLVVAPHPDDETLGCGATIARARHAGIPVHVVLVTDGSGHPPAFPDRALLVSLRRDETLAACGILGVPASHVVFLGFPDGQATAHAGRVAERLAELIGRIDPERVFGPSELDNHADHRAVAAALKGLARRGEVRGGIYCYPVWFWYPRFLLRAFCRGDFLRLRRTLAGPYLDLKKQAIAKHASQAGCLDPANAILMPEFLRRFLRPHEYFFEHRSRS